MRNSIRIAWLLTAAIGASACGMLEPRLPEAAPAIPAEWPLPPTTPGTAPGAAGVATQASQAPQAAADIGWREFFTDPNLEELIAQALANNRDLRVAVLNVEKARAQYRIQRADRVPSIEATGAMYRAGSDGRTTESFSASVGVTDFELDLFGRVRNLSESELQRYFAQEETRRSAQLSLIAEVANVYLTLAADQEQLRLARATLATREESYAITEKRHELGAVSGLDLAQSRTLVEGARADAARYAGQVAQDTNALTLLIGAPVDPQRLPSGFADPATGLAALPAGLPSEVLLRRPDVLAAEHVLRATNANIGAARAAFFPSISLTGSVGSVSTELSGLFDGGTQVWGFTPQVRIPIFEGGRLLANLKVTEADRDIALAQYEKSIQQGFREVADALALTSTLAEQRSALQALVDAALRGEALTQARFEAGRDSYLLRLESQRTLYVAEQALISTRLAEQSNRVTLYKVLGGGWQEGTP
ncbi:MAG: efflux transporter outer membrane subunit [Steroidobacteraceae bacterium]|nr:efflux transporter outer membrane subunit [Steroidobacteraceae bacterium]MBP7610038.1 efflux transporter outer membrane subunit [Steroidobacteraceae bacterium]